MPVNLGVGARNASTDGICALTNGGTIRLFTAGFALQLVSCALSNPAWGASSNGTATANAITQAAATATGTAAVFRVFTSGGVIVWDDTVTLVGGGGGLILAGSLSISSGQLITITSATFTTPA